MFLYRHWKFDIEQNAANNSLLVKFVTPRGSAGTFVSLCFRTEEQAELFMHRYIDHLEGTGKPPVSLSALLEDPGVITRSVPDGRPERGLLGANAADLVRLVKNLGAPLHKRRLFGAEAAEGNSRMDRTLFCESND